MIFFSFKFYLQFNQCHFSLVLIKYKERDRGGDCKLEPRTYVFKGIGGGGWSLATRLSLNINIKSNVCINVCICHLCSFSYIFFYYDWGAGKEVVCHPQEPFYSYLYIAFFPSLLNYVKIANVNVSVLRERKPELLLGRTCRRQKLKQQYGNWRYSSYFVLYFSCFPIIVVFQFWR